MANLERDIHTTLGPDAHFKGELTFEKNLQLLGQFDGQIDSTGQLIVAEGAVLTGEVKAGAISVNGEVKGNLTADTTIQLTASGHLEGDIHACRLEVADGATLIGHCMIGSTVQQSAPKLADLLVPRAAAAPVPLESSN